MENQIVTFLIMNENTKQMHKTKFHDATLQFIQDHGHYIHKHAFYTAYISHKWSVWFGSSRLGFLERNWYSCYRSGSAEKVNEPFTYPEATSNL